MNYVQRSSIQRQAEVPSTKRSLRILVSDYAGHPFQVQLSRELAMRGHEVLHVSSGSAHTPKGSVTDRSDDPRSFHALEVYTRQPFAKHTFLKRRSQEREVGELIGAEVRRFRPDIVLSANAPMDTQKAIQRWALLSGSAFIFWVQDVHSIAIARVLRKRAWLVGDLVGRVYGRLESRLLSRSNAIVAISSDFVPVLEHLVRREVPIDVVENWAPLDEVPLLPRDNEWALQNLAPSRCRFIYSGTLGFKHNPALLLELAKAGLGDVIVFSEGPAAEWLKLSAAAEHIDNLAVRTWLPFESLPNALAAADILVTILEPDAAEFAVPSKVLTYMCAGRAQLGAIPAANLAAALIKRSGSGTIVAPTDSARFVRAAAELAADDTKRKVMARAGRKYAEQAFDIENITNEFELIFERALQEKRS